MSGPFARTLAVTALFAIACANRGGDGPYGSRADAATAPPAAVICPAPDPSVDPVGDVICSDPAGSGQIDDAYFVVSQTDRLEKEVAQTFKTGAYSNTNPATVRQPGQLTFTLKKVFEPPAGSDPYLSIDVQDLVGGYIDPTKQAGYGAIEIFASSLPLNANVTKAYNFSIPAPVAGVPVTGLKQNTEYSINFMMMGTGDFSVGIAAEDDGSIYTAGDGYLRQKRWIGAGFNNPAFTKDKRDLNFAFTLDNGCFTGTAGVRSCGVGQCTIQYQMCNSSGEKIICDPEPQPGDTRPVCKNDMTNPVNCTSAWPQQEVCDGTDNDCNGVIDEINTDTTTAWLQPWGFHGLGQISCGKGVCFEQQDSCVSGKVVTCPVFNAPVYNGTGTIPVYGAYWNKTVEKCDGLDDDCDGVVDELTDDANGPGIANVTCGLGVCQVVMPGCVNHAQPSCQPDNSKKTAEVCDGLDDDCDGVVDDQAGNQVVNSLNEPYYDGSPSSTEGVGICTGGTKTCEQPASVWAFSSGGSVVSWNGSGWSSVASGTTSALNGAWGNGASNEWAVGGAGTIVHWNGSAWSGVTSGTTATLTGIWGSAANDVWAVGQGGAIVHWNGSAWSVVSSGTTNALAAVWGSASNDVWAVGAAGTTLHWNGSAWSPVASGTTSAFASVWGSASNDVWAVGGGGTVFHWNGSAWWSATSGTANNLQGVWGTGVGNAWAVGAGGTILHWDGSSWSTKISWSPSLSKWSVAASPTTNSLRAVWGSGPADGWAAGDSGTILHWNGTAWATVTSGTTAALYAISGSGSASWVVTTSEQTPKVPYGTETTATPKATWCDGYDDDCDGTVDGDSGVKMTQACWPTTLPAGDRNVGACRDGTQPCAATTTSPNTWGSCTGYTGPITETCNGIDDDCNGSIDDGLGASQCGNGRCMVSIQNCVNGSTQSCNPNFSQAKTEVCNGVDDDCDGTVDKDPATGATLTQACYTGPAGTDNVGICHGATQQCIAPVVTITPNSPPPYPGTAVWSNSTCTGEQLPTAEVCNGLDDNCDGLVDNPATSICPAKPNTTGTLCSSGACQVSSCAAGTYDLNGFYGDGCECVDDNSPTTSAACTTPLNLGTIAYGASPTYRNGVIPLSGYSDWYQVSFQAVAKGSSCNNGTASISFSSNPSTQFKMEVMTNSCGVWPGCGTALDTYQFWDSHATGSPSDCTGGRGRAWPSAVYVRVYRVAGAVTCDTYQLSISLQ